jgi:hypothetical protein
MIGTDMQSSAFSAGSYVDAQAIANDMGQFSENNNSSNVLLDENSIALSNSDRELYDGIMSNTGKVRHSQEGMGGVSMVNAIKGPGSGLLGSMGPASSPQANGKVFGATLDTLQSSNSQFSLSIIEKTLFPIALLQQRSLPLEEFQSLLLG